MAKNLLQRGELSLGGLRAYSKPGYPIFIATYLKFLSSSAFIFIVIEALVSTITVAIVYKITARIATRRSAILSAILCAFYPYSLVHDTALQDTVLYNFFSLVAVYCLLRAVDKMQIGSFFFVGILLGLTTLIRSSHLLHGFSLAILLFLTLRKNWKQAFLFTGMLTLGFLLCLSPWLIRNKSVVNAFTLASQKGLYLATAHNESTFDFFPYRASIDEAKHYFLSNLKKEEMDELLQLEGDEMGQSQWFRTYAYRYILTHKFQTLIRGLYKAAVNFLGILSPLQEPLKNGVCFLSYWILTLLAIRSLPMTYRTFYFWIYVTLCFSQSLSSFIFWAHSSHRSFLDPMLAVLAGVGLDRWLSKKEVKQSTLT
jgi:4-amino-4-deoxy-L-arabinose transferase-like glycosyltransferase